jgi:outer membrane protein assembly factor BamD (BamD/ComL family)
MRLFLLSLAMLFSVCIFAKETPKVPTNEIEKAYAQGQIDALSGDTNVKFDSITREYHFTKIPNGIYVNEAAVQESTTKEIMNGIITIAFIIGLCFFFWLMSKD